MIAQKEIKKLFQQLVKEAMAQIDLGGSNILIHVLDQDATFSLSTPIYFGGNFIPKSVRECLVKKPPFLSQATIKTHTTIDEPEFKIYLNYLGSFDHLNGDKFKSLLEEFTWFAEEWRLYLDQNDKQDLIHIRVK